MRGNLIVIEGSDGCGKATQSKLLHEYLESNNIESMLQSFPNYESESAGPVKMYLNSELGDLSQVTAYQASILYATDRFCTLQKNHIEEKLETGCNVICDRYVESNMIHHVPRLTVSEDNREVDAFIKYMEDLEYGTFQIPRPSIIFYLHVDPEVSAGLRNTRAEEIKKTANSDADNVSLHVDIHESNQHYLTSVSYSGLELAKQRGWTIINCMRNGAIKTRDEIHNEIVFQLTTVSNIELTLACDAY